MFQLNGAVIAQMKESLKEFKGKCVIGGPALNTAGGGGV